ncbi:MAG: GrpB family protein [Paenibacillaceae bacterium]|nr:GrpB family protein [Paenibacillaceae bacterium]
MTGSAPIGSTVVARDGLTIIGTGNKGEPRTHQIHLFQTGSIYLKRQLAFRDYLMNDYKALVEYKALKETLSRTHGTDKITYSHEKTDFINSIMEKLGLK